VAAPYRVREARFDGVAVPTRFFRWGELIAGAAGDGPAVVSGGEATAVVPPGFGFRLDAFGNLIVTRAPGR
jgi:N-methylhydantoinase A/oxoprolinase/acetone carboxylase beta subunit